MSCPLILFGGAGRMGRAIQDVVAARDDAAVVAIIEADDSPPEAAVENAVIIDFTSPSGTRAALDWATEFGVPVVSGTTGIEAEAMAMFDDAATSIPVLHAANMSMGIAVLRHLVASAAGALPDFDAEIVELHHRRKKDSPSGTAWALTESLNAGRGCAPREGALTAREGLVGARTDEEIGVFGVRGGDVVGEHTVFFFGEGERVELTHRATDRAIFARGAVRAALWIAGKEPGRYTIEDVLGLA